MKILYTSILSLFTFSVFAQPTLTTSWVPNVGLSTRIYAYDGSSGLSEGPSGAAQTWDLTAYDTLASQVTQYISPSSAPGGSSYSTATDCGEGLSTQGNNTYTFDRLNGNVYQLLGLNQPSPSTYVTTYTRPQTIFIFPETYGSYFSDTATLTGSFQGASPGTITGTTFETDTVDGYGTLITAAGTFNNVLRIKILQTIMDTETVSGQQAPLFYYYETYSWFSPTIKGVTLATISHLDNNGITEDQGFYSQVISTGIQDITAAGVTDWSIIPQPSNDHATVSIQSDKAGETADILMHDMTGRLVYQTSKTLSASKNNIGIDVSALSDGIYTLSVNVEGRSDTQKLVVKH
jgi:hypothetical protein